MAAMVLIYNIFLTAAAILMLPVIAVMFLLQPKLRAGFWQKTGFYPAFQNNQKKKTAVFHAVSAGETNAVKELVMRYKSMHPDENIIITNTTKTGHELALKSFSETAADIVYFPYDFFFSVLSFLNIYKPDKIIIAETEIWPFFIAAAKQKGIKVYIVNGRISPHSYEGYKKIKWFLTPVLNSCEKLFMQSKDDAKRIIAIGAASEKTEVMGNLKFDIEKNPGLGNRYKQELKTEKYRVFIAASTHKGEDEIVIEAFKKLKLKHSDAKMLLAPRHPERFEDVFKLAKTAGLDCGRRLDKADFDNYDVILLDTMGELSKLYSVSYIAFIGGSFSKTGGHNPLEALIWGVPVLSGADVFNFKDIYKTACGKKCALIVNTASALTEELISFYDDSGKYKTFCGNANSVFEENTGAAEYVLKRI